MDTQTQMANRRQGRRWRFATAVLDERSWTLTVNGRETPIEAKPLELLHELVLHAGETVSKADLLAAVWPDVAVVEASLATAMLKVRRSLGDEGAAAIQTVPRVGYRLVAPVELEAAAASVEPRPEPPSLSPHAASPASAGRSWRWGGIAAGAALTALALGLAVPALRQAATAIAAPSSSQVDARDALRRLDVARIEALLHAGWNPNTPFDSEGNGALHAVVEVCEWDPAHDRHKLMLIVRTLLDNHAQLELRNVWGDTAYSIARAKRFCGPDHPVVHLLHVACYAGLSPLGDKCLPSYADAAGSRRKP